MRSLAHALFVIPFAILGACGIGSELPGQPPSSTSPVDAGSAPADAGLPATDAGHSVAADSGADAGEPDAGPALLPDAGSTGCPDLVPPVPVTHGPVIHVAVTGSDATGDGSLAKPFATLVRALANPTPGMRVLLGGGRYALGADPIRLSNIHGTAAEPVVITAEPGAAPAFDASAVVNTQWDSEPFLSFGSSSYVFLDGIELYGRPYPADLATHLVNGKYTGPHFEGGGIGFLAGSSFCTLTRSTIHSIPQAATFESGSDFVIAGNSFYDIVLVNRDGNWSYFGAQGVADGHDGYYVANPNGSFKDWTRRRTYVQNSITNVYSNGFNCFMTDTCVVIGNRFGNIAADSVYMDHGRNVTVLRNLFEAKPSSGYAIAFDNEPEYGSLIPVMTQDNILIADNFIGSTGSAFTLFRFDGVGTAADTWSNVHFIHNVVVGGSFYIQKVRGPTAPHGGLIANNLFIGTTGNFGLEDTTAWTVDNNVFVSGLPTLAAGISQAGNFTATPTFVGPTDGSTLAGFTPTKESALQVPFAPDVPLDGVCQPRRTTTTSAGLIGP